VRLTWVTVVAFGLSSEVITAPVLGTPLILPQGRHHVRRRGPGGGAGI